MARGKFQSRVGTVISDNMDKTVVVDVIQIKKHKRYNKSIKRNTKFIVHDEKEECNIGDKVLILEGKPYSKTKRWKVSKVLEKGHPIEAELAELAEVTQTEITEQS
jgi:small subunit ribosomal protein S17